MMLLEHQIDLAALDRDVLDAHPHLVSERRRCGQSGAGQAQRLLVELVVVVAERLGADQPFDEGRFDLRRTGRRPSTPETVPS